MRIRRVFSFLLLLFVAQSVIVAQNPNKKIGLKDIKLLIDENREVIISTLNKHISQEKVKQSKAEKLPELNGNANSYLSHIRPINGDTKDNYFLYNANIASEIDIYTGGMHSNAIKMMRKGQEISEEEFQSVKEKIQLEAYVLLYDIYRNIKYIDFIHSSIYLREKEYERIEQLYKNGLVLKSDLLRSKLEITDLQKDGVTIENSIAILSERLCSLLGIKERFNIVPVIDDDLNYSLSTQFDDLFALAQKNSPLMHIPSLKKQYEEIALNKIHSTMKPKLKLYATYGFNSITGTHCVNHQLGGEAGAKLSIPISPFYKNKHLQIEQKQRIEKAQEEIKLEEDELRSSLYSAFVRYNESLVNIERAKEKIEMAKESYRILQNSYFNQQALLIDVLESETKAMEASFEWIEAVVNSQKYYWSIKQISGNLL